MSWISRRKLFSSPKCTFLQVLYRQISMGIECLFKTRTDPKSYTDPGMPTTHGTHIYRTKTHSKNNSKHRLLTIISWKSCDFPNLTTGIVQGPNIERLEPSKFQNFMILKMICQQHDLLQFIGNFDMLEQCSYAAAWLNRLSLG